MAALHFGATNILVHRTVKRIIPTQDELEPVYFQFTPPAPSLLFVGRQILGNASPLRPTTAAHLTGPSQLLATQKSVMFTEQALKHQICTLHQCHKPSLC